MSAYCFHPGLVASGFNRNNGALMGALMLLAQPVLAHARARRAHARMARRLARAGRRTAAATSSTSSSPTPTREGQDMEAARALWELSEEQTQSMPSRAA